MLCVCMMCVYLCLVDMQRHACAMTACKCCLQRLVLCVLCVLYKMGVLNEVELPWFCEGRVVVLQNRVLDVRSVCVCVCMCVYVCGSPNAFDTCACTGC